MCLYNTQPQLFIALHNSEPCDLTVMDDGTVCGDTVGLIARFADKTNAEKVLSETGWRKGDHYWSNR